MATYFSDAFSIDPELLEKHGAFNISLITDLPLFIDPFLLFNSKKPEYQALHAAMIRYLVFLKDQAAAGTVTTPLLRAWYCFPEVRQTWLGFSQTGNSGSGLGMDFAEALHKSLHDLFPDFGTERVTRGSHIEKVCLIRSGVGRDNISDFTTNLIKGYLCAYTQEFTLQYFSDAQRREVSIRGVRFNYDTMVWEPDRYVLPWVNDDYVILTPKDILTRDENWISREDFFRSFEEIPTAIPDAQLRAQVENYFRRVLVRPKDREPNKEEKAQAAATTLHEYPELVDYYIRYKEDRGEKATNVSTAKVRSSERLFVRQVAEFQHILHMVTGFYKVAGNTYEEVHERIGYLKDQIENKGCHRIFYIDGEPIGTEQMLQIMYRLVWIGTPSDVSREVNDGRGPADFKISRGAQDKTIVEMKLGSNKQLERNLQKQAEIYQKASDAPKAVKVILFFSETEEQRVRSILKKLQLSQSRDIVLIDARNDNKPSGSKA